jgi:hypothetical protein
MSWLDDYSKENKNLDPNLQKKLKDIGITEDEYKELEARLLEGMGMAPEVLALIDENAQRFTEKLSTVLRDKAESLTLELPNIAPLGDYSKLIEDNDGMTDFLKSEASKPEYWKLNLIRKNDLNDTMIDLVYTNQAVGDGTEVSGVVFINKACVIRHAMVQYND